MSRLSLLPLLSLFAVGCAATSDPLPSWSEGPSKASIVDFVERVSEGGSPDYVAPDERIAVFDNDGTLWSEQPFYFQLQFAMDRIRAGAQSRPEWWEEEPYKWVLENDLEALFAGGEAALGEILMASHAGMTHAEFGEQASAWLASAVHPRFDVRYSELVYQPMLELLEYLRSAGFRTYIVSGGGVEFLRAFAEEVYGIPPEQVIGSRITAEFEMRDSGPVLVRQPAIGFVDDKAGKPVAIQEIIGRRPILAFGNSDGDHQMLQWTAAGDGARLAGLVHHTDELREWAYDRDSKIGHLDAALDEALEKDWVVVDMAREWLVVFPFER